MTVDLQVRIITPDKNTGISACVPVCSIIILLFSIGCVFNGHSFFHIRRPIVGGESYNEQFLWLFSGISDFSNIYNYYVIIIIT